MIDPNPPVPAVQKCHLDSDLGGELLDTHVRVDGRPSSSRLP